MEKLLRLFGKDGSSIEYVTDRLGHDRRYAIDFTKIRTELGWEPSVSLEQGLQETVAWFQTNTEWWQRVKSGAYQEYSLKQYGK